MKKLVVFYSRTGNTRSVAQEVSKLIDADVEEIHDTKNRKGIIGFILSGMDARRKGRAKLREREKDPSLYDLVIIGTPVWAYNISTPVRTYIDDNKSCFRNVAFFCTSGSSDSKYALRVFSDMKDLCGKEPVALLNLAAGELKGEYTAKVKEFASAIQSLEL